MNIKGYIDNAKSFEYVEKDGIISTKEINKDEI